MQESELTQLAEPMLLENRHSFQELVRNGAGLVFLDAESTIFGMEFFNWAAERTGSGKEVAEMTREAMGNDRSDFAQLVHNRLELVSISRSDLTHAKKCMDERVANGYSDFIRGLTAFSIPTEIVSGGFVEVIPDLYPGTVHANQLVFDQHGNVHGWRDGDMLAQSNGKQKHIWNQRSKDGYKNRGPVVMIGDGMNDKKTKESGTVDLFVPFHKWVHRDGVANGEPVAVEDFAPLFVLLTGERNWKRILTGSDRGVANLFIRGALDIIGERNIYIPDIWNRIFLHDRLTHYLDHISTPDGGL